jgi:AcrR family transcriptional regulator
MDGRFGDRVRRDRLEAILAAAVNVLAEGGYDGFRVEEVARRVGVAKGTVYLDFPSKNQLVRTAVRHAGEQLIAIVSEATAHTRDPGGRLVAAVHTAARTLQERPELAIAVECRPIHGPLIGPEEPCEGCRKVLGELVDVAKRAGALRRAENEVTADALLGLLARPVWRRLAAENGVEEALRRAGVGEILAGVEG